MTIYFGYEKKESITSFALSFYQQTRDSYNDHTGKCICHCHLYTLFSKKDTIIGVSCWFITMDYINDKLLVYTSGNGIPEGSNL